MKRVIRALLIFPVYYLSQVGIGFIMGYLWSLDIVSDEIFYVVTVLLGVGVYAAGIIGLISLIKALKKLKAA